MKKSIFSFIACACILLASSSVRAKELENAFNQFLQATCKDLKQVCIAGSECCSGVCEAGRCTACIPAGNKFLTCDKEEACCSLCCSYDYCRTEESCVRGCLISSEDTYCELDRQCCSGCCY